MSVLVSAVALAGEGNAPAPDEGRPTRVRPEPDKRTRLPIVEGREIMDLRATCLYGMEEIFVRHQVGKVYEVLRSVDEKDIASAITLGVLPEPRLQSSNWPWPDRRILHELAVEYMLRSSAAPEGLKVCLRDFRASGLILDQNTRTYLETWVAANRKPVAERMPKWVSRPGHFALRRRREDGGYMTVRVSVDSWPDAFENVEGLWDRLKDIEDYTDPREDNFKSFWAFGDLFEQRLQGEIGQRLYEWSLKRQEKHTELRRKAITDVAGRLVERIRGGDRNALEQLLIMTCAYRHGNGPAHEDWQAWFELILEKTRPREILDRLGGKPSGIRNLSKEDSVKVLKSLTAWWKEHRDEVELKAEQPQEE